MKVVQFRHRFLIGCTCVCIFLVLLLMLHYNSFKDTIFPRQFDPNYHRQRLFADRRKGEFQYFINEKNLCDEINGGKITILIGVFSSLSERPLRDFIRTHWGAVAKTNPKLRLIFILGFPEIKSYDMASIYEESKKYRDIIQANFTDTYRGLQYKSFAFFKWTQTYCRNAKYLLKIDSDMQINLHGLVTEVENQKFNDNFQCGELNNDSAPVRNKDHKWYTSREMFPGMTFPFYCQGAAYLVSQRIAEKISGLPIPETVFPIDDVYMTGILRVIIKEGIEQRLMYFHHHYNITETKVTTGSFSKYIMTIGVGKRESGIKSLL